MSLLVVMLLVLGIEQVRGIPILFLSLSMAWLDKRTLLPQLGWTMVLGIVLATSYMVAFTIGVALVFACLELFGMVRRHFSSQTTALLVASSLGAVVVGWLGQVEFAWPAVVASSLSVVVLIVVSKLSSTQHAKRAHL